MSSEQLFKAILERFGPQYLDLYKNIPTKSKYKLMTICSQSLEAISNGKFNESSFC